MVEESLRWTPTDPVFARFVAEDCELGGVDMPAGAVVHACLAAANRDPSRWDRPDEFDPFRPLKPAPRIRSRARTPVSACTWRGRR